MLVNTFEISFQRTMNVDVWRSERGEKAQSASLLASMVQRIEYRPYT